MACFPGWTWEYIDDNMTIPRLRAITEYQNSNPPTHVLVAAYMGVGTKSASKPSEVDANGKSLLDVVPRRAGP